MFEFGMFDGLDQGYRVLPSTKVEPKKRSTMDKSEMVQEAKDELLGQQNKVRRLHRGYSILLVQVFFDEYGLICSNKVWKTIEGRERLIGE